MKREREREREREKERERESEREERERERERERGEERGRERGERERDPLRRAGRPLSWLPVLHRGYTDDVFAHAFAPKRSSAAVTSPSASKSSTAILDSVSPLSTYHRDVGGRVAVHPRAHAQ